MTAGTLLLTMGLWLAPGAGSGVPPLPKGGEVLEPTTPVHLGLLLKAAHPEVAFAAQKAILDPKSPAYKRPVDAQALDLAMGQPPETVDRIKRWLWTAGLTTADLPSHMLVEANGTAAQVSRLLGVRLLKFPAKPPAIHWAEGKPRLPAWLVPLVAQVTGLDTRPAPPPKAPRSRSR